MLSRVFLAFINEQHLFAPTDRVLLAVSGGLDSMVLWHLMQQAGYAVGVAHVDFGLRGAESDADADFVAAEALRRGVPFYQTRFNTAKEAQTRGESVQETARHLRYTWFATLLAEHRYVAVATAHHLNDVLETVLLNLVRGTGLAGLRGMPARHPGNVPGWPAVVRPLWPATRAQILAYAHQHGLVWREDASNATEAYSRNLLRHRVVPVLEQLNPALFQTLTRSLAQLQAADTLVQNELTASWGQCGQAVPGGLVLSVARLGTLPEPLFRLGEWLRPYGFMPDVLAQCWRAVFPVPASRSGQVFLAPQHHLTHDRGLLWLLPPHTPHPAQTLTAWPAQPLPLGTDGHLTAHSPAPTTYLADATHPDSPNTVYLDAAALPFPWVLRPWQPGDRFRPLGLNKSQLVGHFLATLKLPLPHRQRTWVLVCGGVVVWVVGLRASHQARISAQTTRVATLIWQPNPATQLPINPFSA